MGIRRQARQCSLQLLFQYDFTRDEPGEILYRFWKMQEQELPIGVVRGAEFFFRQTLAHRQEVDQWIRKHTHNWPIDRLSVVDRNILRLAITEFLIGEEPEAAVIINEALEMARSFSGERSVRFVNGILDSIRIAMQKGNPPQNPPQS